jgi:hypothetical protein
MFDPAALQMAVTVLPPAGADVGIRLANGAAVDGCVVGHDDQGITLAVPIGEVCAEDACCVLVKKERGAGFEIDARVVSVKPSGDGHEVVRLAIAVVRWVKIRRIAPRAPVRESALVESSGAAFDVEVIDVAAYGFAFITNHPLQVGEELSVMLNIGHQVLRASAKVANVSQLGADRNRVGCQFVRIAEVHRHLLDQVARQSPTVADRRAANPPLTGAQSGDASALIRRLRRSAETPQLRFEKAAERQMTALYCRACARVTLHVKLAASEVPWLCMNCDSHLARRDLPPPQGADPRAA